MSDFETHPAGTAARITELGGANGVHIFRALSKQEMVEVEKMAADGNFQEAAQKFGGQVTYHQDQRDLPPMTDAELALHLRGRLVPMSVAYRAASRIEQLVATVEQLEASITRANAATAAACEAAAKVCDEFMQHEDTTDEEAIGAQSCKTQIRALATPDQTAALDKLIAEAEAKVWEKAMEAVRRAARTHNINDRYSAGFEDGICRQNEDDYNAILAASKKGGV